MAYNEEFYRVYRKYLQEPIVRQNHDHVFGLLASLMFPRKPRVIDLGCGTGEYPTYDSGHVDYIGIDQNNTGNIPNFVQADYMTLDFQDSLPFEPNAFVSLFSIECCHSENMKYSFYEELFKALPSLKFGLVGGFFYESRRDEETVSETGGIVSYQSIEDPAQHISKIFMELRMHLRTPSAMFGEDVVEVWKFFVRK